MPLPRQWPRTVRAPGITVTSIYINQSQSQEDGKTERGMRPRIGPGTPHARKYHLQRHTGSVCAALGRGGTPSGMGNDERCRLTLGRSFKGGQERVDCHLWLHGQRFAPLGSLYIPPNTY